MKGFFAFVCFSVISTNCNAAEALFAFKADELQGAFNESARARNTGRFVSSPDCRAGTPTVCQYSFTKVIRATVSAQQTDKNAHEVIVIFARPTHNIKADSLISYRIYGDLVHVLSPTANVQARGVAIKRFLAGFHGNFGNGFEGILDASSLHPELA
jgi:hypothetical protein